VRKQCAVCPAEFEAKRAAAKYCSDRCRKRAQRQPQDAPVRSEQAPVTGGASPGGLLAATEAKLATAGRLDGPEGQAALILAARVETSVFSAETGASVASLVRQLHATLAEALAGARAAADPVEDELRAARERRHALAGG
jgi:hypothetical protein